MQLPVGFGGLLFFLIYFKNSKSVAKRVEKLLGACLWDQREGKKGSSW